MGNRRGCSGNSVRLYFWGSKITADGDCSHGIKRCLLLGRKVMTNLDRIFKSRDITLPTKVHLVKVMIFPVVTYGRENWTVKKAEHWKIDAFELWCWRRIVRVPWTARRSNMDIGLCRLQVLVMDREAWCAEIHGVTKSQTWLSEWTELNVQGSQTPFLQLGTVEVWDLRSELFKNSLWMH